mmetsp:Transcript_22687/g.77183  ORF Transcript_22687/g.77183 Transcript_22687/m.77183 type:complete len:221 (-) Transcript_22687:123-785(-)
MTLLVVDHCLLRSACSLVGSLFQPLGGRAPVLANVPIIGFLLLGPFRGGLSSASTTWLSLLPILLRSDSSCAWWSVMGIWDAASPSIVRHTRSWYSAASSSALTVTDEDVELVLFWLAIRALSARSCVAPVGRSFCGGRLRIFTGLPIRPYVSMRFSVRVTWSVCKVCLLCCAYILVTSDAALSSWYSGSSGGGSSAHDIGSGTAKGQAGPEGVGVWVLS